MAETTLAPRAELGDILHRFSIAISAIKVAKEALGSKSLDDSIIYDALTLAIDHIDEAYERLDAAILRIGPKAQEVTHG
jgi:hypothetical protein